MAARLLRTLAEIRAAGAEAVADFPPLTDRQVDQVVAILLPVRDEIAAAQREAQATTDTPAA